MNNIQKIIASSALVAFVNSSWATEVEEKTLLNNLAYGQLIELNQYSSGQQKGLMLRLFETPARDETCGLETGATCKNNHLITVATFDELPEVQVHTLQAKGEFVKADWVVPKTPETTVDQAELVLTFREYHRFATRANPKLPKKVFQINLKITQHDIEEITPAK
ncbi:MAG: hypothetical protein A0129_10515 [Limnobacter sp. CACIAM 66H1]|uniref:hypothetical protein n=1 Tax=Limnobacter sp. CACIAM 66H1 TaxID=1813033 RepID=UPI0007A8749F|nr:hypothetical protein [Limnobacter sp. CACIAM 66H1]KYP10854.1 MAG: hypothetical protein A0129_10515 [Limnobacter sp. CACIAM 66H1]